MKVIYHIDNNSKWKAVLENVKNMIKTGNELGEKFNIEVLVNADAVIALQEQVAINSKLYLEFQELSTEQVVFAACKNALNKFAIEDDKLISFVTIVPAGVIELTKKQLEGYAYIKP
ncbi:DsrE family protein [Clostridioides difficile]